MIDILEKKLIEKQLAYDAVYNWFETESQNETDDDVIFEWNKKAVELNAQIELLRHLLVEIINTEALTYMSTFHKVGSA